jgi:hypothetical protein
VAAAVVNANPFRGEKARTVSPLEFIGEGFPDNEGPSEEEQAKEFLAFLNTIKPAKK